MARKHFELLRYVFKRFSIEKAFRTALPTALYYTRRPALPVSDKPALFTMNILPPMMTVWHHLAKKNLGDSVDITIFDCSGGLKASDFPGATVQKFVNLYAATKSDEFLTHIAKNRKIGWICDDDIFLLNGEAVNKVQQELSVPNTALLSFRARNWWHFEIDGKRYEPSSSYCTAFNREILIDTEHLSLKPADGNNHPSHIGKSPGRYDTCDKANEILLQKGYRCAIIPQEDEEKYITGFSGMSGAVMLLNYFKNPQQTLDFFWSPEKRYWGGNVLFGTLAGMLAITTIQELHEKITGKKYPLRSLPSKVELEKLRREHAHLLRGDHDFERVDAVSEKLRAAI